jgi:hypothetical protein
MVLRVLSSALVIEMIEMIETNNVRDLQYPACCASIVMALVWLAATQLCGVL